MARRLVWIALAALGIAAITAVIFLIRAGDPGSTNWPIHFELRSSDNGVLFQFAQDVFVGRPLDWSFSPQVFVFPEIPISLLSYLLAAGTVQLYYLLVACVNSVLLFLGLFGVIHYVYPDESLARRILRAWVAMLPLLLLPLIGTAWLFEYQLAPTYYFGMYLMIIAVPMLFLARARWVKIVLAVAIALTAASNPLALVFTVPAGIVVLVVRWISSGWRSVREPLAWSVGTTVVAFAIRMLFFGHLQGTSPLSYISSATFVGRVEGLEVYVASLLGTWTTATVLFIGVALVLVGAGLGVIELVGVLRHRPSRHADSLIYFGLVPITGLAATAVLLITEYLYLWPIIILPIVLVFLPLPTRWVSSIAVVAAVALVATGAVTGGATNLAASPSFFSYRNSETRCLDEKLPKGVTIGYSTFSDARRIELTSRRGFRLIQLKSNGVRAYWLTNRDYAKDNVGQFFYINGDGDEPAISVHYIESHFGMPDSSFTCSPSETVLIYTSPSKLAKIKARYQTPPPPGESLGEHAPQRYGSGLVQAVS